MAGTDHKQRAHALLSASGASRWINCTPSPRIEEKFKEKPSSSFAEEGTLAHEFGDIGLRVISGQMPKKDYNKELKVLHAHELYTPEMTVEVQKYIDFVMEEFMVANKATDGGALLLIEQKVDLTEYIPDGFGTNDTIIIADGVLRVYDLKYGKGIRVMADDNPQLKLYGLGALLEHELAYDFDQVELGIIQPRLDHVSTWRISADDLREWGESVVKPKAKEAFAGAGVCNPGDWCRWCKAKARCKALTDQNLAIAKHEFADPKLLTDDQVLEVFNQIPELTSWANAVGDFILGEALEGKVWEGYKLVEGRSNRKWSDDKAVFEFLKTRYPLGEISENKLLPIGKMEKFLTKKVFENILGQMVIKPQGKPTLVDQADKRPALGIAQAKEDFKS